MSPKAATIAKAAEVVKSYQGRQGLMKFSRVLELLKSSTKSSKAAEVVKRSSKAMYQCISCLLNTKTLTDASPARLLNTSHPRVQECAVAQVVFRPVHFNSSSHMNTAHPKSSRAIAISRRVLLPSRRCLDCCCSCQELLQLSRVTEVAQYC